MADEVFGDSHELTVDRFGYDSMIVKKLPPKDDFVGVKIYHTVSASPVGKQQPDPSMSFVDQL